MECTVFSHSWHYVFDGFELRIFTIQFQYRAKVPFLIFFSKKKPPSQPKEAIPKTDLSIFLMHFQGAELGTLEAM
jgi:hypothetical protein